VIWLRCLAEDKLNSSNMVRLSDDDERPEKVKIDFHFTEDVLGGEARFGENLFQVSCTLLNILFHLIFYSKNVSSRHIHESF
jgi:hypothetical protein